MADEHTHSPVPTGAARRRPLAVALVLTGGFLIAEVVGGWLAGSLALLSDAAHMLTDTTALGLALAAIHFGQRPPDPRRTFGYRRFEILAAAGNALLLFGVAIYIFYEAWRRLVETPAVQTLPMLVIAVIGLGVNVAGFLVLRRGQRDSLNLRGAYLEMLSDALGSVGVIAGAVVIHFTGWRMVDPILAVLIGLWVLPRTWRLLNASIHVLLEGTPEGVDLRQIHDELARLPAVAEVHDLHVWSLTSGQHSLTAHLVVEAAGTRPRFGPAMGASDEAGAAPLALVRQAQEIARRHGIGHATIQVEDEATRATEPEVHHVTP